jgi:hypothetical protein
MNRSDSSPAPGRRRRFVGASVAGCAVLAFAIGVASRSAPAHAASPSGTAASGLADSSDLTVTIEIPEVECAGCNLDVRKAVKGAGGVRRLNEGTPKNHLVVTYEPGAGRPDAYVGALHKAGFARAHTVG